MPFFSALSTSADSSAAIAGVLEDAAGFGRVDLAMVFYSRQHIEHISEIGRKIIEKLSPRVVLGCLGESIVSNDREIENTPALALWLGHWPAGIDIEAFELQTERTSEGQEILGRPDLLFEVDPKRSMMILLGDPFTFPISDSFLPSINEEYPGLAVVGGMSSNPVGPGYDCLLLGDKAISTGAVGVLLSGDLKARTVVSQGCRPIGEPLIITEGQENLITELAGQPPLEYLKELFPKLPKADQLLINRGLFLGIALDESRETFGRGDYLIRNLMGFDHESGGLAVTERIRVGQTVQFQIRDAATADEDLKAMMIATGKAEGGLLFSCNGRGTKMFDTTSHDAGVIQATSGPVALAGLFAAGELGPVGGQNYIHGFTASVVLFGD